jgi:hypothetical protein
MLSTQLIWLFTLALPVACIAWTVTHEEIFLEPRRYCIRMSKEAKSLFVRKCFYLFTCEYCFSHYVTIIFLFITHFTLLLPGWRGYLISGFATVWVANFYMSLFSLLRQSIKEEKAKISLEEEELKKQKEENVPTPPTNLINGNGKAAKLKISKEDHAWRDI